MEHMKSNEMEREDCNAAPPKGKMAPEVAGPFSLPHWLPRWPACIHRLWLRRQRLD